VTQDQHPELDWQDGVPVARRFGDPYFSLDDGWAETLHVFLAGNGLPQRFRPEFHIAELGFGTGLNCFAALSLWIEVGAVGPLRFTSFERFPMATDDMARALTIYPALRELAEPVLEWLAKGETSVRTPTLHLDLVLGDARETLSRWDGVADAWFLDGFAPAKNPELWEADLLAEVARHTSPRGTAATYSAAGAVRRGLADAGFRVERRNGYGRKRHMSVATME
jgi:tRNA U34 5-methylaminomethyl-2-thiouridine-forming methyltransferase MnmC